MIWKTQLKLKHKTRSRDKPSQEISSLIPFTFEVNSESAITLISGSVPSVPLWFNGCFLR